MKETSSHVTEPDHDPAGPGPTVVHVVAADLARGAQAHACALRDELHGAYGNHVVLSIFRGSGGDGGIDVALDCRPDVGRRLGLAPVAALRLASALRRLRPDVVVAHGGEPLKYLALAGRARPLVYLKIGTSSGDLDRWWVRRLYQILARRAAVVAAISDTAIAEAAAELGVPRSRLRLVPNGRDPRRFRSGGRPDTGPPRLAFVGQLNRSKRPDVFVEAVERLRRNGREVDAWVAGDGPLLDVVARRAAVAGVEVLGPRHDVADLLARSDIFVFTGAPPEGLPGVLIEAGLSGLPVVTTDVPGAAEVVVDGETGFVVGVDAPDDLYRRVEELVDDAEVRHRMGAAARARCEERFTIAASARHMREVLAEAMARSGASPGLSPSS